MHGETSAKYTEAIAQSAEGRGVSGELTGWATSKLAAGGAAEASWPFTVLILLILIFLLLGALTKNLSIFGLLLREAMGGLIRIFAALIVVLVAMVILAAAVFADSVDNPDGLGNLRPLPPVYPEQPGMPGPGQR
jgi:hypothetical protein